MPKLQHIRSATADKRPDPALLVDGQLSINTAATTPGVYTKNDAGGLIKVGPTHIGPTAPNSAAAGSAGNSVGEHWMDTSVTPPVLRVWDGAAWLVSQGLTGPAGADGAAGPAGADGAAGPQGPQGEVGPQGPGGDGSIGPAGPQGEQGPAGAQGPPGNDGATGPQGPVGPGGDGSVGPTGPQGPPGADSTVPGPQGPAGSDGAAGSQGPPGNDGAPGAQGPQGPQGERGSDGATGPQGPSGSSSYAGFVQGGLVNVNASLSFPLPTWCASINGCSATCDAATNGDIGMSVTVNNTTGSAINFEVRNFGSGFVQLGASAVWWTSIHPAQGLVLDEEQAAWEKLHPITTDTTPIPADGKYVGAKTIEELRAEAAAIRLEREEFIKNFKRIKPHQTIVDWIAAGNTFGQPLN